jgi:hypothetical protein
MDNTSSTKQYIRLYDIEPGKYDCFTVDEYESTYKDIHSRILMRDCSRGDYFLIQLLHSHYYRYAEICNSLGRKPKIAYNHDKFTINL